MTSPLIGLTDIRKSQVAVLFVNRTSLQWQQTSKPRIESTIAKDRYSYVGHAPVIRKWHIAEGCRVYENKSWLSAKLEERVALWAPIDNHQFTFWRTL